MAITETRQYREPFVEAAGTRITDEGLRLLNQSNTIPTATYTGRQFVQGQSALEQQAATAAAGLDSLVGPTAYQQEVIDASLAALQREQAGGLNALRQQAAGAGAFGGSRMAAAEGVFQADAATQRALLESQLRQQGFQQAQQQAGSQLQQQQGLGQYQSQIGGMQRQIGQAQLAADQEQAREAAYADYTRLGLIGPQLASVIGGFPAATQVQSTPPPSATQQLLGLGIGGAGLMGAVKGIFN